MPMFEFYLSDDDFDRLYAIKKIRGKNDLTGNEFAAELLSSRLYSLFPARPEFDESGEIVNKDRYRG